MDSERSVLGLKAVDGRRRETTSSGVPVLRSFDGSHTADGSMTLAGRMTVRVLCTPLARARKCRVRSNAPASLSSTQRVR